MNKAIKKLLIGMAIVGGGLMPMKSVAKIKNMDGSDKVVSTEEEIAREREARVFQWTRGAIAVALGLGVLMLSLRRAKKDYRNMEAGVKRAIQSKRKQRS